MGAQLSAQQQAGLQQQVEVKGQHGEGLQQQQQLLEQGLTGPQRRGQEPPGVVVGRHHVCRDTLEVKVQEMKLCFLSLLVQLLEEEPTGQGHVRFFRFVLLPSNNSIERNSTHLFFLSFFLPALQSSPHSCILSLMRISSVTSAHLSDRGGD